VQRVDASTMGATKGAEGTQPEGGAIEAKAATLARDCATTLFQSWGRGAMGGNKVGATEGADPGVPVGPKPSSLRGAEGASRRVVAVTAARGGAVVVGAEPSREAKRAVVAEAAAAARPGDGAGDTSAEADPEGAGGTGGANAVGKGGMPMH
jgi:hypothetical protein